MQVTLYEAATESVHTSIVAILQFNQLTISGLDQYHPNDAVPAGSEYEYETLLDSYSTQQFFDQICPNGTDQERLDALQEKFSGEGADIRIQAFCLQHDIETNCQSSFDD